MTATPTSTPPGATASAPGTSLPRSLELALQRAIAGEVLFGSAYRAIYATDSSNYRHVPLGVVCPRDEHDVLETLRICRQHGVAVTGRGAGTSLAGQACNEAVIVDMSRHLDAVRQVDPAARLAVVEPGLVLDDLRRRTEADGLTFGPDPATHAWCTIGGMIGNNSCGTHALYAGKTVDNVEALRAVTYGGTVLELGVTDDAAYEAALRRGGEERRIYEALRRLIGEHAEAVRTRYPKIPRRVSGYNLDELLPERGFHLARAVVGSESTCVLVLEATLRLSESPRHRRLVVLAYPDIYTAADHVPAVLEHRLLGLEGFDSTLTEQMRRARLNLAELELLPPGGGWLLAEVGGDDEGEAERRADELARAAPGAGAVAVLRSTGEQAGAWRIRESGLGATARPPGQAPNFEGWEDAAVAPERLGEYLRGIRDLWREFGYSGAWYGHFGQGCVHTRNNFDFSSAEGLRRFRSFIEAAADLCIGLGGSISGEHGDGQARGELLEKMFGADLVEAFRTFKAIWDPDHKMNPGRLVDARPFDQDLRHGSGAHPVTLGRTRFALADDGGSLARAADRCVGVGRCRRDDLGVMCPSYRATRDELHSTRGRAKLFAEVLRGEVTPATWRSADLYHALELCLSCKGCAVDCPTHVDMATYKSEFLSHYWRGRLRPASAYALGLIPLWLRLATLAPRLANAALGEHRLSRTARSLLGISTRRPAPKLAARGFRARRRGAPTMLPPSGDGALPPSGDGALPPSRDGASLGAAAPRARHGGRDGNPGLAALAALAGPLRRLAPRPGRSQARQEVGGNAASVVLWPDTFSDAYEPGRAEAAVQLLARAGERVAVPRRWACCGRPLYDFGMLALARQFLLRVLDVLDPYIAAGIPVVVVEPSCLAAFRDELPGLLAGDPRAARLTGLARSLAEHLEATDWEPRSRLEARVTVHPHCHQRATAGTAAERHVLERAGYEVTVLDVGCCGLAGSFGFEASHDE
ncbi:MAG TPA: FAD-binding and (Fe-S)-binding domain-containing protein, partial [Acidimicrobiales bacterium]|nr:FAD-binding and (Fe-S)-binding domain-containing protein [Acidimicrobiales bacterium]